MTKKAQSFLSHFKFSKKQNNGMNKIWVFYATRGVFADKVNPDVDFKGAAVVQWWFHNLRVACCDLRVVGCGLKKKRVATSFL